jgi:uncharacterized membrane protein YeaQ/YmgE (transglycosylase-associated protein family)
VIAEAGAERVVDLSTWLAAIVGALIILFAWNAIHERRIA